MANHPRVLAVIPARSGSKGLKDKNILPFNGKPLLAWSIEAAKQSKYVLDAVVSTDCNKYAEVAKKWGHMCLLFDPKHFLMTQQE
ncbi:hypothetical protein A6K25_19760 [Alteromonas stellipolaris]|uniref:cytidylyltransferase domain-containing protein n=1 Tax=Alteromonas stellipolaris TaxID=233316 RepID=UPI0007B424F7|nr:hypothetical protein A6K25_19760 [Alteromonas stellipolaris]